MDDRYDYLYNRILDVSAVVHISVKLFSMFIVIKYTPKNHRYHSYFILHIMFWNFMCNLIFTFMHLIPLFPAECFRQDGFLSLLIDSEAFGHTVFLAEMTAATHCGVALVSAFAYRFIVFAFPDFAAKTKPSLVVLLCAGVHVVFTFLILPLGVQWTVSYDDYPEKAELPDRKLAICFYPNGHQKIVVFTSYLLFIIVCVIVGLVCSVLFLLKVRSEKRVFHSETIALQRKLFVSLLMITVIALIFGGIPCLIGVIAACFPHLPYTRYTTVVCVVLLLNHGAIYSVAYLILFETYRDAVKRIFFKLIGRDQRSNVKVTPVHSNVVTA